MPENDQPCPSCAENARDAGISAASQKAASNWSVVPNMGGEVFARPRPPEQTVVSISGALNGVAANDQVSAQVDGQSVARVPAIERRLERTERLASVLGAPWLEGGRLPFTVRATERTSISPFVRDDGVEIRPRDVYAPWFAPSAGRLHEGSGLEAQYLVLALSNLAGTLALPVAELIGDILRRAAEIERDCLARRTACVAAVEAARRSGGISEAEYRSRVAACEVSYEVCRQLSQLLRGAAGALASDPALRGQLERATATLLSCIQQAQQIGDPALRAQALNACQNRYLAALHDLTIFGGLNQSRPWAWVMKRFLPTHTSDCPCCVGSVSELAIHVNGAVEGVGSHRDYSTEDIGRNWPESAYKRNGPVQNRVAWGFGIEFSVPYFPEDCPCSCEWTQFVYYRGSWFEDRSGVFTADGNDEREKVRQRWKLRCKNGKLYAGDFVQQHLDESLLFRTMFFSSATNCPRKWVAVDWKLSGRRIANPADPAKPWAIEFSELGRQEG